uniref:Protein kinase domain-containing protein n=1 Tax=Leersia perrieri TaxID=77586 RepID=A0A0D9WTG6_9ORYZ
MASGLWGVLGEASSVAQLVGVDALGLVSMVAQKALAARRHRDACRRLGQHVELVGGLLRELELAELMRREATRRPLEQLQGALRRCYALVTACQEDCGYLHGLLVGARMAEEILSAQHEIDMYIRLIPLIALVDSSSSSNRRVTIVDATDDFSEERNIGKGGFGTVYKVLDGQLLDGLTVAIKRFDVDAEIFDLKSELQLVRIQHTNLIRLLGWCIHEQERILVYEYMHKGNKTKGALLNWCRRLQIIKGLAEGLLYLHKHCWTVHRDLKPSNILLDHDMNPKIADFGSAVTMVSDVAEKRTKRVVGTSGYIAPEYASQGLYSLKTDVFSFGVLVLEIISGRKNFIMEQQGDTVGNLAWRMWKDRSLHELVDPALCDGYESSAIMRCTQVALLCAQEDPANRPTMTEVTTMLNSESILLSDPKEPTQLIHGDASANRSSTYIGHSGKTIDITITTSAPVSTRVRIVERPRGCFPAGKGAVMASGLWGVLGQASNVAQLVGVDALGLVSMVAQAALAARRHRDARPLEQLQGALRRCYALVTACQEDCGYLHRLLVGARMAEEILSAQHEIDMYIRLIPLIALVDSSGNRRVKSVEGVASAVKDGSNNHIRFPARVLGFTEIHVQGHTKFCNAGKQPLETADLQEQKILDTKELVELCVRTEELFPGFSKFDFSQIVHATDNFSEKNNIGRGGFATVYKGQLPNGLMVAIKRLDEHATKFDFNSELQLAKIQHTNLVKLLGWCIHGKERILVYELALNGSLHHYISDKTRKSLLDWPKRLNIIKGVAEGLVYLHTHSMLWIVHRDLKPENVLLDYNMNPKISDFGSARTLSSDVAEDHTCRVVGTSGFKAPEYESQGVYSVKTDVFSFGVLVLVIISGRKNSILDKQRDTIGDLVRDTWHMWRDGRLHELVDPSLGNEYELAQIMRCAQVALLCTQEDPTIRPTMTDVVTMLSSGTTTLLDDPRKPAELLSKEVGEGSDIKSTCMDQSSQTIDITITSSAPVSTRVRIIIGQETASYQLENSSIATS